ncbi:bifunctional DNA primase/polymerase [Phytoactinopolyspora halotolerans]|uniref:bifunctional DNA primase/polymerase n=1 Tax=Phytoactinopolyspora halotolerans TaxID=1981512 RepID=UPI001C207DAC|nr:bifunctional DNA primase/polymerase [Phytoactinopolyspora halotolerans]
MAATEAAQHGWCVFPVAPGGKTPMIKGWQERASNDVEQIRRWWPDTGRRNVGIATGPSGLVVLDLDRRGEGVPPQRFAGARDGGDALAMLAAEAGAEPPTDTYTVATPSGLHLYFRAPFGVQLRNTAGSVGWRIDTRAHGGFVVGAGSTRPDGSYRVVRDTTVAELPAWLLHALTPPPAPVPGPPMRLPSDRAGAYVQAIVTNEAKEVAAAQVGDRHWTLLRAARTLGRLVGGGELTADAAWQVLHEAASRHIGVAGCTASEVHTTIRDGLAYGQRLPRRISDDRPRTARSAGALGPANRRPREAHTIARPGLS